MKMKTNLFLITLFAIGSILTASAMQQDKNQLGQQLIEAAKQNNLEEIQQLIEQNTDINATDNDGSTALMAAAVNGNTDALKLLVEKGADINATDKHGATALMCAAGNTDALKLLIEKGADVNATDKHGATALMWAAEDGNTDALKLLIEKGADVNATDNNNFTALLYATSNDETDALKLLIENGADVNIISIYHGPTALMWAAVNGNTDALKLLIENGANINVISKDGSTALMRAAKWNRQPCCELLINRMLQIPNDEQRKKLYTFLLYLKKLNFPRDIRSYFKPFLLNAIKEENKESKKSVAYQEIRKLKNPMKKKLLELYYPTLIETESSKCCVIL